MNDRPTIPAPYANPTMPPPPPRDAVETEIDALFAADPDEMFEELERELDRELGVRS